MADHRREGVRLVLERLIKNESSIFQSDSLSEFDHNHKSDKFDKAIENFITSSGLSNNRDEVIAALEVFYKKSGKFFAEDTFYEHRMSYFWDHYIFYTHWLNDQCEISHYEQFQGDLKNFIEDFRYSLFKIKKVQCQSLLVIDEISKEKLIIEARENQSFTGMNKSDYIQGFLYIFDGAFYLSRGLVIHPFHAKKAIQRAMKLKTFDTTEERLQFLSQLSSIQLRHVRHMHVSPERIYSELA